jgi:plasmid stabilization system protein ParE/predicted DNA-binding protein
MATTSIRLSDELKQRIAHAAERAGKTPHAFMLEAISEHVAAEELRADFQEIAEQRYARILDCGENIPWPVMRDYLRRRLAGETVAPPKVAQSDADRARRERAGMARIELAPETTEDFERILAHLQEHSVAEARERLDEIIAALDVLERNPLISRPVAGRSSDGLRELIIGRRSRGYVAPYRYAPKLETVFVLAIRGQREAGYGRS